jgi:glycosyltransferase involved in cell wall biosynthesis
MKNEILTARIHDDDFVSKNMHTDSDGASSTVFDSARCDYNPRFQGAEPATEILFMTSYPPRECGIATYSQDLIRVINNKFGSSLSMKVCALETKNETFQYDETVIYTLNTTDAASYRTLADDINRNGKIKIIVLQHEFGFFHSSGGQDLLMLLKSLMKPIIIVFHTVLPKPDEGFQILVKNLTDACASVVVMTHASKEILMKDYGITPQKIEVIPHGTHLVSNNSKAYLKEKYGLTGKKVLSTFGLISSGKGIETTLVALPEIVNAYPEVIFLVLGKTHPEVIRTEGEKYRDMLMEKVVSLHLEKHVRFVNQYLELPVLLEYLRLTDIYLFTSLDPNQAVSGTFSYAMSCGCAVISTPIPQAREMLDEQSGIIIGFQDSPQLAAGVNRILSDEILFKNISLNTLHRIAPTAWENSAIAHALLFEKTLGLENSLRFSLPEINLNHVMNMTTGFGIIQFSKINQPDMASGYTLDDNARALIALCMHYELTKDAADLKLMDIYLKFIRYCMQPDGAFLNYVDHEKHFTSQNSGTNLEDANGRAIWALGYLISRKKILPAEMFETALGLIQQPAQATGIVFSTRAMAFSIKGLYYYHRSMPSASTAGLIEVLAERLVAMYDSESENSWNWYESYLTYANAVIPEAMLCASLSLKKSIYRDVAVQSFDFLLSQIFNENEIRVISNKSWLSKGGERSLFGEQPIDISYTILALHAFYRTFGHKEYMDKLRIAFSWYLGNNHLNQIIYNPCTGGSYDGLEETHVNLNQGAESAVSYLMARLTLEKYEKLYHLPHVRLQSRNRPHAIRNESFY